MHYPMTLVMSPALTELLPKSGYGVRQRMWRFCAIGAVCVVPGGLGTGASCGEAGCGFASRTRTLGGFGVGLLGVYRGGHGALPKCLELGGV